MNSGNPYPDYDPRNGCSFGGIRRRTLDPVFDAHFQPLGSRPPGRQPNPQNQSILNPSMPPNPLAAPPRFVTEITDYDRLVFMHKLTLATREKNGLVLPDWEHHFLGGFLQSPRQSLWFTSGRRSVVDRMWQRFGMEIGHPHPADPLAPVYKIPAADPDACQYLVREDGRQRPCNEPATCLEPGKLRYCALHGESVERDMKRQGKTIRMINVSTP